MTNRQKDVKNRRRIVKNLVKNHQIKVSFLKIRLKYKFSKKSRRTERYETRIQKVIYLMDLVLKFKFLRSYCVLSFQLAQQTLGSGCLHQGYIVVPTRYLHIAHESNHMTFWPLSATLFVRWDFT